MNKLNLVFAMGVVFSIFSCVSSVFSDSTVVNYTPENCHYIKMKTGETFVSCKCTKPYHVAALGNSQGDTPENQIHRLAAPFGQEKPSCTCSRMVHTFSTIQNAKDLAKYKAIEKMKQAIANPSKSNKTSL